MKAIVYTKYGSPDVLQLKEVEKPTPREGEVLIKIHAAAVNPLDWHFMRAKPLFMRFVSGLLKPKNTRLGADLAGVVEAVGSNVEQFQPGNEVFGDISLSGPGAFAEYACVAETAIIKKPSNLTFKESAAVPVAAITALQCLRDQIQIQPAQKILINGASGGVGTFAVQIAKYYGAEVTGVCSTRNLEMVRSIGADEVVDYTQEDFTQNGQLYDLILDNVGNRSLPEYQQALKPGGIYLLNGYAPGLMIQLGLRSSGILRRANKKMQNSKVASANQADLYFLRKLLEDGKIVPVIDKSHPLNETAEAIRYLEKGHARGKVVIIVEH